MITFIYFQFFLSVMKLWVAGGGGADIFIFQGIIQLSWMSTITMVSVVSCSINITVNNNKWILFIGVYPFSIPWITILIRIRSFDAINITITVSPHIALMVITPFLPVLFNISFTDWLA